MKVLATALFAFVMPLSALAGEEEQTGPENEIQSLSDMIKDRGMLQPESFFSRSQNFHDKNAHRFKPYRANYGLFVPEIDNDDWKIKANYSFRYSIFDCRRKNQLLKVVGCWETDKWFGLFEPLIFLSYTGEFDFYWGSRDSGPVVNRVSNPALHFYSRLKADAIPIDYIEFALEHRSNGQVIEVGSPGFQARVVDSIARNRHSFFDKISREANYLNVTVGTDGLDPDKDDTSTEPRLNWQVSYKVYENGDNEVTWGAMAGEDVNFDDYDLARISLSKTFRLPKKFSFNRITLSGEYTVGKQLLETDSFDIALVLPYNGDNDRTALPIVVKYHHGPMATLSDYTRQVNYFGFGLAFWY